MLLIPTDDDYTFEREIRIRHEVYLLSITGNALDDISESVTELLNQQISDTVEEIQIVSQSETQSTVI